MESTDENHNPLQEQFEPNTEPEEIRLTYNDVPEYLRSSEFFITLAADDSTELSVPRGCFKLDDTVNNVDNLSQLFKTLDYWGVSDVPQSAFDFCNRADTTLWASAAAQLPGGKMFREILTHITVKYRDIPLYLHTSELYLSLSGDDENEEVSIPRTCFKMDDTVSNVNDLGQLLRVMGFWGIDRIPNSVLDFCGTKIVMSWEGTISKFSQDCNIHKSLTKYFAFFGDAEWKCDKFVAAIDCGRVELIEHWMNRNPVGEEGGRRAAQYAADRGHLKALQILNANAYPLQFVDCAPVAEIGHTECLQYLRDNGATVDENCCYGAASRGHLECLRYLIESGCPRGNYKRLLECSAETSHSSCYRYVTSPHDFDETVGDEGNSNDDNASFHLIHTEGAPLEELQMLRNNGAVWDESVSLAALYRDITFLQYVMLNGCPHTNDMILRAAAMTRKDTTFLVRLQFLVEDMLLPLSNELFTIAAMYGSVNAVQYLVDVGCPCEFVALPFYVNFPLDDTSVLESMEYAKSHRWPVTDTFLYFVHNNQLPLCQATFPLPGEDFVAVGITGSVRDWDSVEAAAMCVAAARNQYLRLVYFVNSTLFLLHIAFSLAVVHGSVECVFYLVDAGYPCVFEVQREFMMPDKFDDARIARCLKYSMRRGVIRTDAVVKFVFGNDLPLCQALLPWR